MLSIPGLPQFELLALLRDGAVFLVVVAGFAFMFGFRSAALRALALAALAVFALALAAPGNTLVPRIDALAHSAGR